MKKTFIALVALMTPAVSVASEEGGASNPFAGTSGTPFGR